MKPTTNTYLPAVSLRSQNLLDVVDSLKPTEKLEITKLPDGMVKFSIVNLVGGHKVITPVHNKMVAHLRTEPVKPGWMSYSEVEPERVKSIRKDHKHKIRVAANKNKSEKEKMIELLEIILAFKDMKESSLVTKHFTEYRMFTAGNFIIYTKEDKSPVMYQEGNGEMIYLVDTKKPALGTYKMTEAGVVPV
jgi:hypothetical protein